MAVTRLVPAIKNYIWGGRRLKDLYGKTGRIPLAESWELSCHPDGFTQTPDGTPLKELLSPKKLGKNCEGFVNFPLLVKWIDAESSLSVQVHPSDEDAFLYEKSYGKTEMWYVVSAKEGAGLYLGFCRDVTEKEVEDAAHDGTLATLLNFVPVKAGDCYFIPAGTVHAICEGCLILEIQQNSNITYRLFDYGRRDSEGNLRPLHIKEALRVAKREVYTPLPPFLPLDGERTLGISRYFHTAYVSVQAVRTLRVDDASFLALFCIDGKGIVGGVPVSQGDSLFLDAGTGDVSVNGDMVLIAVSVRRYTVTVKRTKNGCSAALHDDLGRLLGEKKDIAANSDTADALFTALLSCYGLTEKDVTRKDITETC